MAATGTAVQKPEAGDCLERQLLSAGNKYGRQEAGASG